MLTGSILSHLQVDSLVATESVQLLVEYYMVIKKLLFFCKFAIFQVVISD